MTTGPPPPEQTFRRWRHLVIWGPFREASAADLDTVASEIGVELPEEYRNFLTVANGGTLEYAVRLPPASPDGELIGFSSLFDACGDGPGSLLYEWRGHSATFMAAHLPEPLLPVARDGGGSMLYLDLRLDTFGEVWAFVHGLPAWAGGTAQDMGGRVAASWDEYLTMLTVDELDAREIWEDAVAGAEEGWLPSVVHWLDAAVPHWREREWGSNATELGY